MHKRGKECEGNKFISSRNTGQNTKVDASQSDGAGTMQDGNRAHHGKHSSDKQDTNKNNMRMHATTSQPRHHN